MTDESSIRKLAERLKEVKAQLDKAKEQHSELYKEYEELRKVKIPNAMEELGTDSMRLKGIGTVSMRVDSYCSVHKGKQEDLQQYLIEQGYEDLIKPTVNPSTLKAQVTRWVQEGEDIPEDIINFQPYTYATIVGGNT